MTQEIAAKSCNYRDNHQLSEWNPLSKIEWLRLYPLKKVLFGIFWLVCLYISVRGIFLTVNNPRKTFIFLTVIFCAITLFTARKVWRYIRLPYHCIPVLNHIQTKEELKEALQGECFEEVPF